MSHRTDPPTMEQNDLKTAAAFLLVALHAAGAASATTEFSLSLDRAAQVEPHYVSVRAVEFHGSPALEIQRTTDRGPDGDTFAFVPGLDFHDGTIEVDVAGSVLPNAIADARGFIGIVFRVQVADGTFACEGIYLRPTNGRAQQQLRRNRSTQYFAYPGFDFVLSRREAPGQYESYVDLVPDEWTPMRIEVRGATAKLFVGSAAQPALIVNDLKHGADAHGSVGLWVGVGTEGHFRNLRIRKEP